MLRLRFHASWLPDEHNAFWTIIDPSMNIETIADLIRYFIEQEKSLANFYQFHLSKRMTKLKYIKAFLNDCVLPPHALVNEILRDNDQIYFHLEIDSQTEWLVIKSAPVSKPKQPKVDTLDQVLETIASTPFNFQFGNKRGRPIPPRPQVISSVKVNSLVPRQVLRNKTSTQ